MSSPKMTTHPPVIRYETESRIENIETASQNLAQIMEERKIKGEKTKKTVDLLKGRTPAPPHHRQGGRRRGERGPKKVAAAESPLGEGAEARLLFFACAANAKRYPTIPCCLTSSQPWS